MRVLCHHFGDVSEYGHITGYVRAGDHIEYEDSGVKR